MYRTKDQVALEIIAEGRRRKVSDKGIVIALATGLVESSLIVYANGKVPESLALPHDAVGSDGLSVGVFQQQVRKGTNGQWWWADAATCMDPTKSAGLFFDRLARQRIGKTSTFDGFDYNTDATTPGGWAQMVQQSAFPDRYDQRMSEAKSIFNRLAGGTVPNRPDFNEIDQLGWDSADPHGSVRSRPPVNFFLHTQEGDGNATDLAAYLRSTKGSGAVSYHYTIREDLNDHGVTVVDVIDTDLYSWAVLSANVFSINLCFAGSRASWTREQWMTQSRAIDVAAYLAVQDCRKYSFSTEVIKPPYGKARQGISDHKYVTQCLGIGTHTDVGDNFPWDVFEAAVKKYAGTDTVPSGPVPTTPPPAAPTPVGPADDQLTLRWHMLGDQTPVEALAEIRDHLLGTSDRDKIGAL